jgi:hypothetical protein
MFIVSAPLVSCRPSMSTAWTSVSVSVLLLIASAASAQTTDVVGVRAQGMAGAFTAVADDATASWWNPGGLAGGGLFSGVIEYSRPNRDSDETVRGFTAAYPALGVSYYRLPLSQIRLTTSTAPTSAVRQDQGVLSLYGATFGQSLGEHLVVGSTLKLLHATDTHVDLDIGAMASVGPARFGVTVRDVTEPTFGSGADAFTLDRHVRAGAALTSGRRGVIGSATLAFDADLTREQTAFGDERYIALGGEVWAGHQSLGLRGGFSKNTVGTGATQLSGGLSAAVRKGTFVDAYVSGGPDDARHGWGVSLRVTF